MPNSAAGPPQRYASDSARKSASASATSMALVHLSNLLIVASRQSPGVSFAPSPFLRGPAGASRRPHPPFSLLHVPLARQPLPQGRELDPGVLDPLEVPAVRDLLFVEGPVQCHGVRPA